MKISRILVGLIALSLVGIAQAQSMFRGDAAHSGTYSGQAPRQFHRLRWKFQTGDRVISSPVCQEKVLYFGSDDGNIYAVDAEKGDQLWKRATGGPAPSTPAVANETVYAGSYDGKFYALNAQTGAIRWKFATGGERRFEAKGIHGLEPRNQTMADQYDVFLSSPVIVQGAVYFGSGDGHLYALDAASGELKWKFKAGDVIHASPAYADGVLYVGSWDSFFYAVDAATGQEKWRFNNEMSWVISSPAVAQGKVFFATSDSSLYHVVDAATGKPVLKQQDKAYMFSSPTVVGDVVLIGVLNGTLEARDLKSGGVLWDFQTETSKQNKGWVLTADRKFNEPMLFHSSWREAPVLATEKEFNIGAIFSSPLVVNGVVYFGSTDGNLYAID